MANDSSFNNHKLALFDVDKTIYDGHIVVDFPIHLTNKGIIDDTTAKNQSLSLELFSRGEIIYEELAKRLLEEFALGLKGLEVTMVTSEMTEFLESSRMHYFYAVVTELKNKNYDIYLVSGEPNFVNLSIVKTFNLAGEISSVFEINGGVFTGLTGKLLYNGEAKKEAISTLVNKYQINESIAFGDSMVDVGMLGLVAKPVCVEPDKKLSEVATEKKWTCIKRDEILEYVNNL